MIHHDFINQSIINIFIRHGLFSLKIKSEEFRLMILHYPDASAATRYGEGDAMRI